MGIDGNGHYRKFGKTNPWQTREAVADVLMQNLKNFSIRNESQLGTKYLPLI